MTDKNFDLNNDFEDSLEMSLKSLGYLFPTSEKEIINFEKNNISEATPPNYPDAQELLRRGRDIPKKKGHTMDLSSAAENLGRAARHGTYISDEIAKRMKADRDRAENDEEQI